MTSFEHELVGFYCGTLVTIICFCLSRYRVSAQLLHVIRVLKRRLDEVEEENQRLKHWWLGEDWSPWDEETHED